MPLPDITVKGGFGVDLVLMHIDLFFQDLHNRSQQARMGAQATVCLVIRMGGKGGARDTRGFAPDLFPVGRINGFRLVQQKRCFFAGEQFRQEDEAFRLEIGQGRFAQFHDTLLFLQWAHPILCVGGVSFSQSSTRSTDLRRLGHGVRHGFPPERHPPVEWRRQYRHALPRQRPGRCDVPEPRA